MSETKHTPGPWVAKPTGDTQWKVCHSGSEFGIVCVTSQGNDKANAELIAAAPDLLRALTFWFPDKEDSRAANSPTEWARDNELLKRLKD